MPNTTWNPADLSNITLSGGNLLATQTAAASGVRSVARQTTGKYYWEYTITSMNQGSTNLGIANATPALSAVGTSSVNACYVNFSGGVSINGSGALVGGAPVNIGLLPAAAHGVVCFALDMTGKLFWLRSTGAGQWNAGGTANPATGIGGIDISAITSTGIYALFCTAANGPAERITANFGDTGFSGAVPAGFIPGFPVAAASADTRVMVLA